MILWLYSSTTFHEVFSVRFLHPRPLSSLLKNETNETPLAGFPQLRLLDSIDATLKHPLEHIQQSAVAALKAVLRNWFPAGADGPSERLQKR